MPAPKTKAIFILICLGGWFASRPVWGQKRMWHLADMHGKTQFSIFADTLYSIDSQLFVAKIGSENILFRDDPFHPISRGHITNWLPGIPGIVFQKRGNLMFPTDSKTLKSNPAFVFDSVCIWNNRMLGRYRRDKAWIWNPGKPDELLADSIDFQEGHLILFQFRGIVLIDSSLNTKFYSNSSLNRKLSPGFLFSLSDSTWNPIQPGFKSLTNGRNSEWWNDTVRIDFESKSVFFQSAHIGSKRIADFASILNPHFLFLKTKIKNEILTSTGKRLSTSRPLSFSLVSDTILGVQTSKGWILITKSGSKAIVNKAISQLKTYSEGLILAKSGRRFGFIDVHGFIRIACRYDSLLPFSHGLAAAKLGNEWGYLNASEKIIVQPHYAHISAFKNGLAAVSRNGKWGLLNQRGDLEMDCIYDSISPGKFSGWQICRNRWKGWADEKGKMVLQTKYFHTIELSNEFLKVEREGKTGLFDPKGTFILPLDNQKIILDRLNRYIIIN